MAGHSKWANIQHRKGRQHAKRGKVFTKLIKEITVAAKMGGGDPNMNPRLRLAIDKAKGESMPKDNIENAIKRGTGQLEGVSYEEIRYEGYGIGGAAVMVDCLTDNKTRTVAEVRHAFAKHGGNMGAEGSVSFQFKHCGQLIFAPGTDEAKLMDAAIEAGAEDVGVEAQLLIRVLLLCQEVLVLLVQLALLQSLLLRTVLGLQLVDVHALSKALLTQSPQLPSTLNSGLQTLQP